MYLGCKIMWAWVVGIEAPARSGANGGAISPDLEIE